MKMGWFGLAGVALAASATGCVVASTHTCGRCSRHLVAINDRVYEVDTKKHCARRVYIDNACEDEAEIVVIEETDAAFDD